MSADHIGLFSAFGVFTGNAGSAFDTAYIMPEQLEAAHETGKDAAK